MAISVANIQSLRPTQTIQKIPKNGTFVSYFNPKDKTVKVNKIFSRPEG
jgi:hypothetical protein